MFIIDTQGFQYKNSEFICKELTILDINNGKIFHTMVNLPHGIEWFNEQIQDRITWLTNNIHGLQWNQSDFSFISYESISDFIKKIVKDETIFVKGYDKKIWLSQFITNNIEEFLFIGCPNLEKLKRLKKSNCNYHCNNHYCNNKRCSKENVLLLYNWYMNKTR